MHVPHIFYIIYGAKHKVIYFTSTFSENSLTCLKRSELSHFNRKVNYDARATRLLYVTEYL
jgi:hypothetical protein